MKMLYFLETLLLAVSVGAQIFGENLDQNYGPVFSRVDSDLDDSNMFENFVDFSDGNFHNFEDQMVSESVLTEEQLTARQVKLRELYKGRRPVAKSGAGGIRMNFFNRLKENKDRQRPAILSPRNRTTSSEDKKNDTDSDLASSTASPDKLLDLHQSGMAVTVVKPPPDFVPSPEPEASKPQTKSSKKTPFDWTRNKQKQRAALATSIIGSRLKDLKDKRKLLMNSNLVTERPEQRAEESQEDEDDDKGAQVLTVSIQEKSSENNDVRFPTKKRRFKPQIKPTAGSQKWSIKEKLKNKNKLQVASVTKGKTKEKHENIRNEANVETIDKTVKQEENMNEVEPISEELLNEVYETSDDLIEDPIQSEPYDEKSTEPTPEWMKKPKKMGKPLKKIDVEESAAPISIVPHGVPISRGFGPKTDDASRRVLVLPSAKPIVKDPLPIVKAPAPMVKDPVSMVKEAPVSKAKAPVPVTQAPSVTQFLQFLPFTTSTLQTTLTEETEQHLEPEKRIIEKQEKDKKEAVEKKEEAAEEPESRTTEDNEIVDLGSTTVKTSITVENLEKKVDVKKMTADMINENIEKVLNVTMPKHTKLLYGTEEGRRVEPDVKEVRLI